MKDSRFIELVNLYVDRQITAHEASELEAEMQANPRRRPVYRQYCQMQRATTLVYESFRTGDSDLPAGAAPGRATVTRFEEGEPKRWKNLPYYVGGLVAACVALVLVQMNSRQPVNTPLVVAAPQAAQKPALIAQSVPAPVTASPKLGLVSLRDNLANEDESRGFAGNEPANGRLPSLFEDGVFDTQPGFAANNQRTFHGRQTPAQQAEFTAFQFQR